MGLLSFLFGGDGVIRLSLPPEDHALALAWFREGAQPPEQDELVEAAAEWIEERADDPFRARLRRALAEDGIEVDIAPRRSVPEPPLEALQRFSEEGWEQRFSEATHVAAIRCAAQPSWPPVSAWIATLAATAIAKRTGGIVLDPAIPRLLPRAGDDDERVPGDGRWVLSEHVVTSFSPGRGEKGWLTTHGLLRFGLPEIEVRDIPVELAERLSKVALAAGLRLVGTALDAPVNEDDEREVELDAALSLHPRDVAAAQGEEAADDGGLIRPVPVVLVPRSSRTGPGFLSLTAPKDAGPHDAWLASVADALVPVA